MKYVQISRELFFKLLSYHLLDRFEEKEEIEKGLEAKLNTMVNHEIYSKSKTAPTEEEREKSRQEYLEPDSSPILQKIRLLYILLC